VIHCVQNRDPDAALLSR